MAQPVLPCAREKPVRKLPTHATDGIRKTLRQQDVRVEDDADVRGALHRGMHHASGQRHPAGGDEFALGGAQRGEIQQ